MSSGAVILTTSTQDVTEMGGLWSRMPATTTAFLVSSAALVGIIPLGGFWAFAKGISSFAEIQPWLVGVILLVNGLTAFNLARLFRLVFLGSTQLKSRRGVEVAWPMAVPMVSLVVMNLLLPLVLNRFGWLPIWSTINPVQILLLIISGVVGWGVGSTVLLTRIWSRSLNPTVRMVQDFLAYDFYVERLYKFTVVLAVNLASRFSHWCDRYLVDGLVNFAAFASVFGGETLKYGTSGQSQAYLLTMLAGVSMLVGLLLWSLTGGLPGFSWQF
jgi:NAD(P)H-quinone oxidoreductase subunit 5